MGHLPVIHCDSGCRGCPAMQMTKQQFLSILEKLESGLQVELLQMEAITVFCEQRRRTCVFHITKAPN